MSSLRLRIEALDPKQHDRASFTCGNEQLDRYLHRVAAQASEAFRAQTFVLTEAEAENEALRPILGFYSLAYHEYRDDEMDEHTARALKVKNLKRFPTILLGQLAIASTHQGKRLGPMLLNHALRKALQASFIVSGVAVVTDPIDDAARSFYAHHDFVTLPGSERMFIAMRTLQKLHPNLTGRPQP